MKELMYKTPYLPDDSEDNENELNNHLAKLNIKEKAGPFFIYTSNVRK